MENQFARRDKKQRYLILILSTVMIIIAVVVWWGFFKKDKPSVSAPIIIAKEINIDFDFLESQIIKDLQPFKVILPYEDEAGRRNPFLPYGGSNIRVETDDEERMIEGTEGTEGTDDMPELELGPGSEDDLEDYLEDLPEDFSPEGLQ